MQVIAADRDTIDQLCWQHLGRTQGVTESALALNPHLAEGGPHLTAGTPVTLPERPAHTANLPTVQLWD